MNGIATEREVVTVPVALPGVMGKLEATRQEFARFQFWLRLARAAGGNPWVFGTRFRRLDVGAANGRARTGALGARLPGNSCPLTRSAADRSSVCRGRCRKSLPRARSTAPYRGRIRGTCAGYCSRFARSDRGPGSRHRPAYFRARVSEAGPLGVIRAAGCRLVPRFNDRARWHVSNSRTANGRVQDALNAGALHLAQCRAWKCDRDGRRRARAQGRTRRPPRPRGFVVVPPARWRSMDDDRTGRGSWPRQDP